MLKFKTPGKVNVEIGGGAYYAFLTNDEYRGKDKDFYTEDYRDQNFPSMNDWGWILSSTVNYNINSKWHVFINGQITTGKEEYFENTEGKMGSTELTFGVGYRPFPSTKNTHPNDSLGKRINIIPHTGINISHTKSSENKSQYNSSVGYSSGISLNFSLGNNASLLSGAWYERKGYGLNYDGKNPIVYQTPSQHDPDIDSKIQSEVKLDYITIPFQFEISFGEKLHSNFNFGPYFSLLQNVFSEGERIEKDNFNQGFQLTRSYFNESFDEIFKKGDAGFIFGYRMEIPVFSWGEIFVAVNQSFGAVDLLKKDVNRQSHPLFMVRNNIYNNSTSILFGLNIPVVQN